MTDPEPAGGVGLHDFADVPHELREGVADLPVLDHEGLGGALCGARCRSDAALEMRAVLAFACHCMQKSSERKPRDQKLRAGRQAAVA